MIKSPAFYLPACSYISLPVSKMQICVTFLNGSIHYRACSSHCAEIETSNHFLLLIVLAIEAEKVKIQARLSCVASALTLRHLKTAAIAVDSHQLRKEGIV